MIPRLPLHLSKDMSAKAEQVSLAVTIQASHEEGSTRERMEYGSRNAVAWPHLCPPGHANPYSQKELGIMIPPRPCTIH
jgi:hypothetical protein